MASELEFSALHSDDRLLDALAVRGDIGTGDPVAILLAALAAEVDARPVPIADALASGLLSRPLASARTETAAVSAGAAAADAIGHTDVLTREPDAVGDDLGAGAAPPVAMPPIAARRRWHMMLPRAAATAGVAAVVLGAGGVAAAVGGGGGAFDGIRQVVGNVIKPVAPSHAREDKVSRLLDQASAALKTHDAEKAHDLLVQAKSQLTGLQSSLAKTLQEKLTGLQSKLDHLRQPLNAAVPVAGAGAGAGAGATVGRHVGQPDAKPSAAHPAARPTNPAPSGSTIAPSVTLPLGASPEDAAESPADARADGITHDLPGPDLGNPADNLPGTQELPGEAKITEAEREVQEKAGTVPVPGPDEVDTPVGPVHPLRTPSAVDVFDDPSVRQVVIDAAPKAGSVANGVTGGGNP